MNIIGAPDEWIGLIDTLVPDVLNLVLETWKTMPPLASDAREDPTTEELCRRLRQNRDSAKLPFRIDIQTVELEPNAGEDQGRMDITFSPTVPREDIYFCLECKRLNVVQADGKRRPYTAEYVTHGMLRFVRGQYAKNVKHGGMLAYVLDGKVTVAIGNVGGILKKRFKELGMTFPGELASSSISPHNNGVKETHHSREYSQDIFQIHHIFAAGHTPI
ncbi:hypothetical protein [Maritalea sp.]|uniref:hypothetical protein n=1 Tax=Maritalea sp. TaxID=2003361 RepID=UPI003EF22EF2